MTTETVTVERAHDFLAEFCATHGLTLELEGECGFGRECVGILHDGTYVDCEGIALPRYGEAPSAYYKHDCLAVLGRGDEAVLELYRWMRGAIDRGAVLRFGAAKESPDLESVVLGKHTRTVYGDPVVS